MSLLIIIKLKILALLRLGSEPAFPTAHSLATGPKLFGLVPLSKAQLFDVFFYVCVTFIILETVSPHMFSRKPRWSRARFQAWVRGVVLAVISYLTVFLVSGTLYNLAARFGIEPLNLFEGIHPVVRLIVLLLAIDGTASFLHFLFHKVPWMWTIHKVHHIETYVDSFVTNKLHPIESLFFGVLLFLCVYISGCSLLELVIALNLLKAFTIFLHSDWRLPFWFEKRFGVIFMTSGHHHIHHDRDEKLHHSNFGLMTTLWDRILGTYNPPEKDRRYNYGLPGYSIEKNDFFRTMLLRFRKDEI